MGFFIYNLNNEKTTAAAEITSLKEKISNLETSLEEKITSTKTENTNKISNSTETASKTTTFNLKKLSNVNKYDLNLNMLNNISTSSKYIFKNY